MFSEPLPRNGPGISSNFAVVLLLVTNPVDFRDAWAGALS
jgi:hypothetical protein